MAQKIITTLVSDLSNTEEDKENGVGIETVEFGLDGNGFEMELTTEEATALREALSEFVRAARKSGGTRTRGTKPTAASRSAVVNAKATGQKATATGGARPKLDREQSMAIRAWAKQQGMEVSERGRIPNDVTEAYEKAHGGRSVAPSKTPRASVADAPTLDSGEWDEAEEQPHLSAVPDPDKEAGDDPADDAAPAEEEKVNGRDGLTHSRREAIREWAQKQGMEVKAKGIIKKDLITSAEAWEKKWGTLDVAPAESSEAVDAGPEVDELREMLP